MGEKDRSQKEVTESCSWSCLYQTLQQLHSSVFHLTEYWAVKRVLLLGYAGTLGNCKDALRMRGVTLRGVVEA